jgi:phage repressor protein C with HTH and peptisase S24 domain
MLRYSLVNELRLPKVCIIGASRSVENLPIEGWIRLRTKKNYRDTDRLVAAPIEGNSLNGDRINDGDIAIIRLTFDITEIKPGDICAVLTPYGCLLKHVYLTLDNKMRLVSSNPSYQDILLDIEQVEIQGLLEEVIINFR